jgi:hypothetical protein
MIILNVNDLLDAARDISESSPGKIHPSTLDALERALVNAAGALASTLASAEGVTLKSVANERGFGGLCAEFTPGPNGETSDTLQGYDAGGEWGQ